MNYTELLNKLLEESGLQQKEILARCKESGEEITQSYISNLKTKDGKTASEKVSRAIAKACNAKYEDILVVQAYIDKAPKPILEFLNYAKRTTEAEALLFLDSVKENMGELEFKRMIEDKQQKFRQTSLAEFICEIISDQTLPTIEGFKEQIAMINKKAESYPISGDLYAVIPIDKEKGIKYLTESELNKITEA